jgi:hypothetical protein
MSSGAVHRVSVTVADIRQFRQTRRHHMNTATTIRRGLAAATVMLAAGAAVAGGDVSAKGTTVEARGACSRTSNWKLKAKPDNGAIEVDFEVDSNRVGQTWAVRITDNGVRVFSGTARTVAPSGSFTVERRVANRAGVDTITAVATNAATGERCAGSVRL